MNQEIKFRASQFRKVSVANIGNDIYNVMVYNSLETAIEITKLLSFAKRCKVLRSIAYNGSTNDYESFSAALRLKIVPKKNRPALITVVRF